MKTIEEINKAILSIQPNEGQVSDGYHTFDELYDFRRAYNAALVNTHKYPCIKSYRHSDGELCFGGGWFVVQMQLPTGQISNHYENKYWDEFDCEVRERADEWDGHTEKDVLERLTNLRFISAEEVRKREEEFDKEAKEFLKANTDEDRYARYREGKWNFISQEDFVSKKGINFSGCIERAEAERICKSVREDSDKDLNPEEHRIITPFQDLLAKERLESYRRAVAGQIAVKLANVDNHSPEDVGRYAAETATMVVKHLREITI